MKTILIPTDFSINAQNATDYGVQLFDGADTRIVLLNTYYLPYATTGEFISVDDIVAKDTEKRFDKEQKRIGNRFPEMKATVDTLFEIGDVVSVVRHLEGKASPDVIVMGTKGASGWNEILVGSRTASMTQSVDCPMVVVPENAQFTPLKKILFTTDLETIPETDTMDVLLDLARTYNSEIQLLHVEKDGESPTSHPISAPKELNDYFTKIPHAFKTTTGKKVAETIETYIKSHPTDLLVMISEHGNLFHRIFHRSVTKKVTMHTEIPVLVLHKKT